MDGFLSKRSRSFALLSGYAASRLKSAALSLAFLAAFLALAVGASFHYTELQKAAEASAQIKTRVLRVYSYNANDQSSLSLLLSDAYTAAREGLSAVLPSEIERMESDGVLFIIENVNLGILAQLAAHDIKAVIALDDSLDKHIVDTLRQSVKAGRAEVAPVIRLSGSREELIWQINAKKLDALALFGAECRAFIADEAAARALSGAWDGDKPFYALEKAYFIASGSGVNALESSESECGALLLTCSEKSGE